ncbi:uncharacterized protein LOC119686038 [Teleopsis dalmanni]|uniref:uncharacterized protein LOC119686038 n=1 Tax=Teleopsis dalmanni TaxID=139649 RepID=UPI000D32B124|nr:uncharacterized protein LOC119686038 [Teleopsis dalmanni]
MIRLIATLIRIGSKLLTLRMLPSINDSLSAQNENITNLQSEILKLNMEIARLYARESRITQMQTSQVTRATQTDDNPFWYFSNKTFSQPIGKVTKGGLSFEIIFSCPKPLVTYPKLESVRGKLVSKAEIDQKLVNAEKRRMQRQQLFVGKKDSQINRVSLNRKQLNFAFRTDTLVNMTFMSKIAVESRLIFLRNIRRRAHTETLKLQRAVAKVKQSQLLIKKKFGPKPVNIEDQAGNGNQNLLTISYNQANSI